MSVKVMDRVWEMSRSKGAARLVLLALADWADDDGFCFPSLTAIVRKTQLTRPGVVKILRTLTGLGELEVTVRGHDTRDQVKAKAGAMIGWQATNYYRIQVGNAVYHPRKRQVVNPVDQTVGNAVDHQVVNGVSGGSKPRFEEVVNAVEKTDPLSLNDPSVLEPSKGERAAAPLPSPADLVGCWNAHREPGPKVAEVTPSRQRQYRRALRAKTNLADWRTAIVWLNHQAYANAPGTGEHPTWRASLDWLAKPGQLAKVLESAHTDAQTPPQRPRRVGDTPSQGMTPADAETLQDRAKRRQDHDTHQAALVDEASRLVLELSEHARRPLELDALEELEPFRSRVSAAEFDEFVCKALPLKLLRRANGRPLTDVVRELEAAAA